MEKRLTKLHHVLHMINKIGPVVRSLEKKHLLYDKNAKKKIHRSITN